MLRFRAYLIILTLLSLNACSTPEHEIKNLLDKRWNALQSKNINFYSECISDDYPEREKILLNIESYLKKVDRISLISSEPVIYREGDSGTVFQKVRIRIEIDGEVKDFNTMEKLTVRKTKNGWRITGGIK